jgi:hypothetical protein
MSAALAAAKAVATCGDGPIVAADDECAGVGPTAGVEANVDVGTMVGVDVPKVGIGVNGGFDVTAGAEEAGLHEGADESMKVDVGVGVTGEGATVSGDAYVDDVRTKVVGAGLEATEDAGIEVGAGIGTCTGTCTGEGTRLAAVALGGAASDGAAASADAGVAAADDCGTGAGLPVAGVDGDSTTLANAFLAGGGVEVTRAAIFTGGGFGLARADAFASGGFGQSRAVVFAVCAAGATLPTTAAGGTVVVLADNLAAFGDGGAALVAVIPAAGG